MIETPIFDFCTSFYTPEIQTLSFQLPHVSTIITQKYGKTFCEALKSHIWFQYLLCQSNYSEIVVASFAHRIKSEYYSGNRYVYTEVI